MFAQLYEALFRAGEEPPKKTLDPRKHLTALPEDLACEVIDVDWRKIV
ncbi:hypothetical protein [Medusavirus stheno T3]|uniref:Uncharacterized protein n=1 Tax=Medusavirus stheno T3 TaxID=3069717 RepID=A0A7S7YEL8_9VIRU|nr:hypothetical protein QKU73_gp164 [Acanthamoeba castellanii medusavirus]QPB44345.1 hypothetical protein [Medusavirus stheno T3]